MAYLKRGNSIVRGALNFEEGTWTPSPTCGYNCHLWAISGTVVSSASYTKIGNMCHIQAKIVVTKTGTNATNSFNMNVEGFPFPFKDAQHPGIQLHCDNNGEMGYLQFAGSGSTTASPIRGVDNTNLGNTINPVTYYMAGSYQIA
tara:strand:- start:440 stop:874 length:435 start_codon:yes stop_codon:yes gene_type:complete